MRTGFYAAAALAATVSAECVGENCENAYAQIGRLLADMPEEHFQNLEAMLAQIESGEVPAQQLLAQTGDDETHANLANLATMLAELDESELAQVTSFMEDPTQLMDTFAPLIDDLAQVAGDMAGQVFPEDAPILQMSQTDIENEMADLLDQGANFFAQFPEDDIDGLYDVMAETETLALDWVDNLSPKSINAFETAFAQVKEAGLNWFAQIKDEDKERVTNMFTQTDYGQFAMAQIDAAAPGLIDEVTGVLAQLSEEATI